MVGPDVEADEVKASIVIIFRCFLRGYDGISRRASKNLIFGRNIREGSYGFCYGPWLRFSFSRCHNIHGHECGWFCGKIFRFPHGKFGDKWRWFWIFRLPWNWRLMSSGFWLTKTNWFMFWTANFVFLRWIWMTFAWTNFLWIIFWFTRIPMWMMV